MRKGVLRPVFIWEKNEKDYVMKKMFKISWECCESGREKSLSDHQTRKRLAIPVSDTKIRRVCTPPIAVHQGDVSLLLAVKDAETAN